MKKRFNKTVKLFLVFNFFLFFSVLSRTSSGGLVLAQNLRAENQQGIIDSLRFRETDIRTVIRAISAQAYRDGRRINIITSPQVTGLVTIELEEVSWQDALRVVLRAHNYGYEWIGDYMILVATLDEIATRREKEAASQDIEAVNTETFRFNFAKVEDLRDVVRELVSNRGRVTIDKRTNVMIVSDTQSNLENIRRDIRALDSITPQVLIEAKIIETSFDALDKMGIEWDFSVSASGSQRPHVWPFGETFKDKHFINDFPAAGADPFTFGTLDASGVSATLDFILRDAGTQILSQPKIMTMDNNPANIKVTTEEPLPNYSYNTDTGMWEISGFEYKEYGVYLEVTPQINEAGFITLVVEPEVSDLIDFVPFESGAGVSVRVPRIETRTASTQVMIKDRETLVIGGLIKDKEIETIKKIPFLGDIPLLGWLFKHKNKEDKKTNLLVFITPRIMTPEIESPKNSFSAAEEKEE